MAMVAGQLIDLSIAKRLIASVGAPSPRLFRTYLVSSAINALAWGALDVHLWLNCGVPGQWFALLVACGGLVHASLRLYPVRAVLSPIRSQSWSPRITR